MPDGSVWFTTYDVSAAWHIEHGYLHRFSVAGGPVGITYWHRHLWTPLHDANQVGRLSLGGRLQKTYALPADANPLQIAASKGDLWTSGDAAVYAVSPRVRREGRPAPQAGERSTRCRSTPCLLVGDQVRSRLQLAHGALDLRRFRFLKMGG